MTQINLKTMREEVHTGPLAIAIGNFDGVHIGHRALLDRLRAEASARGLETAVWCFAEPPSAYLPGGAVPQLVTLEEKLALFAEAGIDRCILGDFAALRDYSPERFAREILDEGCDCRYIVCGFNFSFGARGQGTPADLHALFPGRCAVVDAVSLGGTTVSSTAIRAAIAAGDMPRAAQMLGRPWAVSLPVLHGKALGRTIGVPTLNQHFPEGHILPAFGVYATRCAIDGRLWPAVTNVGIRPSVDDGTAVTCESHVLDLSADLYDRTVRIEFHRFLRPEQKFVSLDALRAAIEGDIAAIRAQFSTGG